MPAARALVASHAPSIPSRRTVLRTVAWTAPATWMKDTATNTRYVSITAGQGAAFPVVFTLTWNNNSVSVGSFTGTITATLTTPDHTPSAQTLRA